MVYFRSNNFGIEDFERESFDPVHEQEDPISSLCSGKDGVVAGSKGCALLIRKGEGRRKKIAKFDRDVSAVDVCGELAACGDESGHIKVIGKMKSIVRQYYEHEARINEIRIDGTMLVSCSDDMKIKIFDLSKAESVATISDSTDYVRSIDIVDGIVFSGSYDGFVRGHCLKTLSRVVEYNAGCRISRICALGSSRIALASGNEVRVIDVSGGIEIGRFFHIKEVTSMVFYGHRLYTASLDANVRVFTTDLKMISRVGVRGGILDISIFDDVVYLGLEDGGVLELVKENPKKSPMVPKDKGDGLHDEVRVDIVRNPVERLTYLEKRLNRFEYKKSMMHAMEKRDVQEMFAAMSYIHEKRGFVRALQDLSRKELAGVLDVIVEFFTVKEFVPIFSECIGVILSLYERDIEDDPMLAGRIEALASVVDDEVYFQEQNLRSIAFLECFGG
uniref:U3 small nucleolar RNA-associated protein 15 C-terminal domain-containing protein n=1 Tax=Encephalitozoon cuniculi TaxID=6035 RepID=M1JHN4_ENCCN|nr:hypothetical protein ECU11_1170 [Encephalitozoon cuniculi]